MKAVTILYSPTGYGPVAQISYILLCMILCIEVCVNFMMSLYIMRVYIVHTHRD